MFQDNLTNDWYEFLSLQKSARVKPVSRRMVEQTGVPLPEQPNNPPQAVSGAASIAQRAESVYRKGWIYQMGGSPSPSIEPGTSGVTSDCGGFVRWASGVGPMLVNSDQYGPLISRPEVGCAIRFEPVAGEKWGHAGIVTQVYPDGDFDTLDCGSTANDMGSIRKKIRAKQWWTSISGGTYVFRLSKTFPPSPGNLASEESDNTDISAFLDNAATAFGYKAPLSEGRDNNIFTIRGNQKLYQKNEKYFKSLLRYIGKKLSINRPVEISLIEDEENSQEPLGRTGGYINEENKIHIFTNKRHIKDILRSLAHEMVHHKQDLRGEFKKSKPTEKDYTQKNPHLRKMEEEAYLQGNMLFRDWEDNYKYRRNNNEK